MKLTVAVQQETVHQRAETVRLLLTRIGLSVSLIPRQAEEFEPSADII